MYRVEDKFICSEREMLLLESRIKILMSTDSHSNNGSYRITSVYFDDDNDSHLSDSEDGVSYRSKYRIRFYNNNFDVIKLEVKFKKYNRVYKISRNISVEDAKMLIQGKCIPDGDESLRNPITLFNLKLKKDLLRPTIIVDYDRRAYIYSPGNVRITFDRNVSASKAIDKLWQGDYFSKTIDAVNKVLEIKYDEFLPEFISQLLECDNMIQTSFSKYKLCREQMRGARRCL